MIEVIVREFGGIDNSIYTDVYAYARLPVIKGGLYAEYIAAFLIVIILTAAYFVKEIMYLSKLPVDASATPDLLKRANIWYQANISRDMIQDIALIFFIIATIKSFKA